MQQRNREPFRLRNTVKTSLGITAPSSDKQITKACHKMAAPIRLSRLTFMSNFYRAQFGRCCYQQISYSLVNNSVKKRFSSLLCLHKSHINLRQRDPKSTNTTTFEQQSTLTTAISHAPTAKLLESLITTCPEVKRGIHSNAYNRTSSTSIRVISMCNPNRGVITSHVRCMSYKKEKSRKSQQSSEEEDSDDESDIQSNSFDEVEDDYENSAPGIAKDYKDTVVSISSLRLDLILKTGLNISRAQTEDLFYGSKIRHNTNKVVKKSTPISLGDEVDVIIGSHEENENLLDVQRVLLKAVGREKSKKDRIMVKLRRWKKLTVENYLHHTHTKNSTKGVED